MQKKKTKIISILLENKRVNNYTKLMIILNQLDYFEDYYIPNRKLCNFIKTTKYRIRELLHQLEEDKIIAIFYKGRKRYFTFIGKPKKEDKKEDIETNYESNRRELFDYNWLEDEE